MWLTSKRPAAVRTAVCSSVMVVYWTGMSQPPKSTMRAPWPRCQSYKGVRSPIGRPPCGPENGNRYLPLWYDSRGALQASLLPDGAGKRKGKGR